MPPRGIEQVLSHAHTFRLSEKTVTLLIEEEEKNPSLLNDWLVHKDSRPAMIEAMHKCGIEAQYERQMLANAIRTMLAEGALVPPQPGVQLVDANSE